MSAVPQTAGWQAGFLNLLPAVQTHAQIQFRHLPLEQREDAIQEAIASACVSYQILAAEGRLHVAHPGTLATFAVNFGTTSWWFIPSPPAAPARKAGSSIPHVTG